MKTFKEHISMITEGNDPPMLLQLRRVAIRNFPGGERVALFSNPQLNIKLAVPYDASTGKLKPSNTLPIKEEHNGYSAGKSCQEIVQLLKHAHERCKQGHTELDKAICGWMCDEIKEFGEFENMPEENLRDNWDDYCALMHGAGHPVSEAVKVQKLPALKDLKDDPKELKLVDTDGGEEEEDNDDVSSEIRHRQRKMGSGIDEQLLSEAPIHRINTIMRTGKEDNVLFKNGATNRVHPATAQVVHNLFHKVNSGNKRKLAELINASPEGLEKVAKFAHELINGSKEANKK